MFVIFITSFNQISRLCHGINRINQSFYKHFLHNCCFSLILEVCMNIVTLFHLNFLICFLAMLLCTFLIWLKVQFLLMTCGVFLFTIALAQWMNEMVHTKDKDGQNKNFTTYICLVHSIIMHGTLLLFFIMT